jgi:hypothetical protein
MGRRKHYPSARDLDAFSRKRLPEIASRWRDIKDAHQQAQFRMWAGSMVLNFNDDELAILDAVGFLCPLDKDLLRDAGRPIQPHPSAETAQTQ